MPLEQSFSMNFTCPVCTEGYDVGLREYYVNQEVGMYDNRFTTSQNNQFRQIQLQLIPIIINRTDNLFGIGADYTTEIKISPLTSTLYRNDLSLPSEVEILFGTA